MTAADVRYMYRNVLPQMDMPIKRQCFDIGHLDYIFTAPPTNVVARALVLSKNYSVFGFFFRNSISCSTVLPASRAVKHREIKRREVRLILGSSPWRNTLQQFLQEFEHRWFPSESTLLRALPSLPSLPLGYNHCGLRLRRELPWLCVRA